MTLQELNNQPTYWKVLDSTYETDSRRSTMIGKIAEERINTIK